jgi:DNA-binding CsgD family transcriptional regulator
VLVGRSTERVRIDALLDTARAGSGGALVVRGEPGVGKTALLGFARERAGRMRVIEAQGVEAEAELPFAGLSQLLAPMLDRVGRLPEQQRRALAGALGLGDERPSERFAAYVATLSLVAEAAEDDPVLALIDDLHWLDAASVEALAFVARRIGEEPIALLLAERDGEPGGPALRHVDAVTLNGLDAGATAALVAAIAAEPVADAIVYELRRQTAGNPLALVELAGFLSTAQLAGAEPLPEPLPAGAALERTFGARMAALPKDTQRALLIAAAHDSGELPPLIAALRSRGLELAALEPAEAEAHVTVGDDGIAFRHPLLRSAAYYRATHAARRDAHAALAAAFAGLPRERGRRAWHLAAATLEPSEDVAAELDAAAVDAFARGAPSAAGRAFEVAARLTEEGGSRAQRLMAGARAHHLAGAPERALRLLDETLAATDDPLVRADVQRLRAQAQALAIAPRPIQAMLIEEAALVEPHDPARASGMLLDAAYASTFLGEPREALRLAEQAWPAAKAAGGTLRLAAALVLGGSRILRGDSAGGEPLQREALALLDMTELALTGYFLAPAGMTELWLGRYEEGRRLLAAGVSRIRAQGALTALPHTETVLAFADFFLGDWAAARVHADESMQIAIELDQQAFLVQPAVVLGLIAGLQGRFAEGRTLLHDALERADRYGVESTRTLGGWAQGQLELAAADYEATVAVLEPTGRFSLDRGLEEPGVAMWAQDLAEAYIRIGRLDEAEATLAVLARQAAQTGRALAHAGLERCRGLIAGDEAVDTHFERALEWHEGVRCPCEQARTELCFGERLRRAGRRSEARAPLRRALEAFELLGAEPWAERARCELRSTGERVRRRTPDTRDQLTPQELRVALLVVDGATNREAAATLFVTPKTIETHLNNAYRKLGIRSRVELARHMAYSSPAAIAD